MSGRLSSAALRPLRAASASLLRSATPRPRHVLRCIPLAPGRPDRPSNGPPSPPAAAAAAAAAPPPQPPAQAHHLPRPRPGRPGPLARRRGQQQAAGHDPPPGAAERGQTAHRLGSPRPVGRVPSFRPSPPLPPVPYRSAAAEAARPAAAPGRRTFASPPARTTAAPPALPARTTAPPRGPRGQGAPGRWAPRWLGLGGPGQGGTGSGTATETGTGTGSGRPGSLALPAPVCARGTGRCPRGTRRVWEPCVGAEDRQVVRRRAPL